MKATLLTGFNIKGCSFSHELAPITIFVGPNAGGKSARLDAAKIALLGYDLRLGKLASSTFKLVTGNRFVSLMAFDNRQQNAVTINQVNGKLSQNVEMPVKVPGILLDINDYFGKSGPQRSRFLFDLAGKGMAFDVKELIAAVKNIRLEPHTSEAEHIIAMECETIHDMDLGRQDLNTPLDKWFAELLAAFDQQLKGANAITKQMRASLQANTAIAAQGGMPVMAQDCEAELKQLRATLAQRQGDLQTIRARVQAVQVARAARVVAERELADNPAMVDDTEPLRAAALKAKAEAEALVVDNNAVARREAQQQRYETLLLRARTTVANLTAKIEALDGEMKEECPKCGSKKSHWPHAVIEAAEKSLDEDRERLTEQQVEVKRLEGLMVPLEKEIKADKKQALAYQQAREKQFTVATHYELRRQDVQRVNDLRAAAQRRLDATPEQPTDEELEIEFQKSFTSGMTVNYEFDVASRIDAAISGLNTDIGVKEAQQRLAVKAKSEAALREKTKEELGKSETRAAVLAEIVKVLTGQQEAIIATGITAFMAGASELLAEVVGKWLEFRDGEIGYWAGTQWVSTDTFSGLERSLAFIGLQLALAKDSPIRIAILDEMGILDPENKRKLLRKVSELMEQGKMDNFIGADVSGRDYTVTESARKVLRLYHV